MADLIQPDVAAAIACRLREFAEHHQFGQRGRAAGSPDLGLAAEGVDELGMEEKRQALVAADVMIMGADIFVAGMADHDRSGHQFERAPALGAAEAALAHIGDGMGGVLLDKRL